MYEDQTSDVHCNLECHFVQKVFWKKNVLKTCFKYFGGGVHIDFDRPFFT